jgi:precorrin-6Y C5,15-methyltransferase (decarboxylating) CbiT subunit
VIRTDEQGVPAGQPPLLARYGMQSAAIYARGFAQIDTLLAPLGLPSAEHQVARRVVHATGDPELASLLRFHPQAIDEGLTAIEAHCPIVVDIRMVAAGVNAIWLAESGCPLHCAIEASGASARAAERSITRSAAAIDLLAPLLDGALVVVGNAPTALLALLDLVDAGAARPALVIGMPVGFVAAAESKDALMRRETPWISIPGLRGGSAAAAAAVNALLRLALDGRTPQARADPAGPPARTDTALPGRLLGLPDEFFARRGPSPSLITKREVRAVALAHLGLQRQSVVWDVGTGSGSVGIEAALLASAGRVYGIDRHPEAIAVATANAHAHGAATYVACPGEAPAVLKGLPDPDAVFVGGSGGALTPILEVVAVRLRPGGRVVVALATFEHLHEATACLTARGLIPAVTSLNVARSRPVGALTRLEALNPVYLVTAEREVGP